MNEIEMVDVSEDTKKSTVVTPKKDKFMIGVYTSLIILIILGLVVYFFGYEILKPFIKV